MAVLQRFTSGAALLALPGLVAADGCASSAWPLGSSRGTVCKGVTALRCKEASSGSAVPEPLLEPVVGMGRQNEGMGRQNEGMGRQNEGMGRQNDERDRDMCGRVDAQCRGTRAGAGSCSGTEPQCWEPQWHWRWPLR
jgi:hypothetical protein